MDSNQFHRLKETVTWYLPVRDKALPWYDRGYVSLYERKFDRSTGEWKEKLRKRLLWSLVHSEQMEDVHCAMTMLQGSLLSARNNPRKKRKAMYLLAVGYYRLGNYLKCRDLVVDCLEIAPNWYKALYLKLLSQDRIKKEALKDKLTAAVTTVGVVSSLLGRTTIFSWVYQAMSLKNSIKECVKVVPALDIDLLQVKEDISLLANRYYIRGNYPRSDLIVDHCLEIDPEWRPAITLKKLVESARRPSVSPERSIVFGETATLWICIAVGIGVMAFSGRNVDEMQPLTSRR